MMVADVKETLENIEDIVPGYQGQGYEIVGLAWFQGWNDFCAGHGVIEQYPKHLSAMFRDVRKDLVGLVLGTSTTTSAFVWAQFRPDSQARSKPAS